MPAGGSCQSYYQRTLWDGDQILYEWRVADGTATGYNSGTAGYVHVEGIDQPVGLIRSDGTRVLNYTWRGLGESSVFTNGAPGDVSIPGGSLAIQWPTRTQGGVYFTPNALASGSSGPFTWFGTLAENGAGSTGLLYRRNRFFDPVSGRFTQADPIGLAGGLNLYGFANGDPVNFSDPFGLCPDKEDLACTIGARIRGRVDAGIDAAFRILGSVGNAVKDALPGLAKDAAIDAALAAVPVVGEVRAGRRVVAVGKAAGTFLSESRHVRGVKAARKDFADIGSSADEVMSAIASQSAWQAVAPGALAGGQVRVGSGTVRYTLKRMLSGETVANAWIP